MIRDVKSYVLICTINHTLNKSSKNKLKTLNMKTYKVTIDRKGTQNWYNNQN